MFRKEFLLVLCLLTFYQIAFVFCDSPMLGPADSTLKKFLQCENPEQYPSYFLLDKKKVNRTHEVINGVWNLDVDLDETVAIYFNLAKWGDGGYKPNSIVYNDTNACEALMRFLENDIKLILRGGGRPEKCPIKAGSIPLVDHRIDYRKVPQEAVYGDFKARVLFYKDGVTKFCLEAYFECKPKKLW